MITKMSFLFLCKTLLILIALFGYIVTLQLKMKLPPRLKHYYEKSNKFNNYSAMGLGYIDGHDAPPGSAPFVVSLRKGDQHVCGGSLISSRTALTSAHCALKHNPTQVRYGTMEINQEIYPDKQIKDIIVHKNYNSDTMENDIALIIMQTPIELSHNVDIIKVNTKLLIEGTPVFLFGWGSIGLDPDSIPDFLQMGVLYIVGHGDCRKIYWDTELVEGMICARDHSIDPCLGDCGGPLITRNNKLIGLFSWGPKNCPPGKYPSVFTRASTYLDWIETNMQ